MVRIIKKSAFLLTFYSIIGEVVKSLPNGTCLLQHSAAISVEWMSAFIDWLSKSATLFTIGYMAVFFIFESTSIPFCDIPRILMYSGFGVASVIPKITFNTIR